jgi:glycosyltransferase involved in cell wall biosynthesis
MPIVPEDKGYSGTWLNVMANSLDATGEIVLGIVAIGECRSVINQNCGNIKQWLVPRNIRISRDGLPPSELLGELQEITKSFNPDIINIWGTEYYFGLLTARGHLNYPAILTLQGVKYRIASCYEGCMTKSERQASRGLMEVLLGTSIEKQKSLLKKWEPFEKEIMAGHDWSICQTPWQEAQIKSQNSNADVFRLDLPLRSVFERANVWKGPADTVRLFCSAPYVTPAKGLHVAVRALAILKRRFPAIQLRIAGMMPSAGIKRDGYLHWLAGEIYQLGLDDNICWLGRLSDDQIADELSNASVMVIPTFIESYCMALAEAMRIGIPTVVSYTGGTAYLGKDEETCLFFPPGDDAMCAYQLDRVLTNQQLALRLSRRSKEIALIRNDRKRLVQQQLDIYDQVLSML